MIKKLRLALLLSLTPFTAICALADANTDSPLPQYQQQIQQAQAAMAASSQKNYYPKPQIPNFTNPQLALNYIAGAVNSVASYMATTLTTLLFQQTPYVNQAMATGKAQNTTIGAIDQSATMANIQHIADSQPYAQTLTDQAIFNTLTAISPTNNNRSLNVQAPVTMTTLTSCSKDNLFAVAGGNCEKTPNNFANVNFNSLLGPFNLTPNTNPTTAQYIFTNPNPQQAQNFIQYVSGEAAPIQTLDLSQCTNSKCLSDPRIMKYIATLRSYAAQQSAGLATLYRLLSERTMVTDPSGKGVGFGAKSGLPTNTPGYPEASPLQVDYYMASRRVRDPNWYVTMETANPTTIARENLYVNAETRYELFRLRLELERLQALFAVMQLQQLRGGQIQLDETLPTQLRDIYANVPPYNGKRN